MNLKARIDRIEENIKAEIGPCCPNCGRPPVSATTEEWQSAGEVLKFLERSTLWWVGDWLNYGESKWGEMYSQALDATEYAYDTLSKAKQVSEKFGFSRRLLNLSWSHHFEAAFLPPDEADALLGTAESEGWSTREIREAVNLTKQRLAT